MEILVTGGAGYIGGVTAELLRAKGEKVVILDDLVRGHRESVDKNVPFYEGKVGDEALVARILKDHKIEECIHFAALAYVGESVSDPGRYYSNNVEQGVSFMDSLLKGGVKRIIFSSTCATYGEPEQSPISETCPQWPTNPYGWSKFMMERILESYDWAYGLKFVGLRYFNASGATDARGECHDPEPHLVPNVLSAASGKLPEVAVFGQNYPTPDGTCVRDYIHVADLADAHIKALEHLRKNGKSDFINLGTGHGYSVLEVIRAAEQVTGYKIKMRMDPPRPGDPPRLVADARKAKQLLGWEPRYDMAGILRSQWEWRKKHPQGYVND